MRANLVLTLVLASGLARAGELDRLPLYFIENQGQADPHVSYYVQGPSTSLYFSEGEITFALSDEESRWAVKLRFLGAREGVHPEGLEPTGAVFSYFKGEPSRWKTSVGAYQGIVYRDLWPGIDLVYSGTSRQLKYSFLVRPGADPGLIRLAVEGATDVEITEAGALAISTPIGGLLDEKPYSFQESRGQKVEVSSAFTVDGSSTGKPSFGIDVGTYDRSQPLVIDPLVRLSYSGFIGGISGDIGYAIALDASGNAFIAGHAFSNESSFPVAAGPDLSYNDTFNSDAFVCKIDKSGTSIVYCGYIGGSATDAAYGIAVDSSGHAFVTGETASTEATFPIAGAIDSTYNFGASDAFVAKVHPNGTSLVFSGYIGGSGSETGRAIAVDGSGNAYITGETGSNESSFPIAGALDPTFNGGTFDAFVTKLDASGVIVYSGYVGGNAIDEGRGIAVDPSGSVYVAGRTGSNEATFPDAVGPDPTSNGGDDAFIAKVNPGGTALDYAGYIGGSGFDEAYAVDVDGAGSAYVVGFVASDQTTFPETVGPDLTYGGGASDGFIAKVSATGATLVYCGYIGGAAADSANGVAVDGSGRAYVTGDTSSDALSFPLALGPDLAFNGNPDAYVASVSATGAGFVYSGYIGGANTDIGRGIAVDGSGAGYVVGSTSSSETSFPVLGGPRLVNGGSLDAFVAKVSMQPTIVKLVGFETADATEIVSLGAGSSANDGITVRPGSGLFSLRQLAAPTVLASGLAPLSTVGLRFSFLKPSNPAADRTLIQFKSGAVNLWALELRTDGILQVREDEALGFPAGRSGVTPLGNSTWHTVRLAYDRAPLGVVRVWLDAALEIDITHTTAGTAIDAVEIVGNASAYNFDDFHLTDTAGPPPLGQIQRLHPDGQGSASGFDTPVPSASREQNVDELAPGDTDYNRHAATTDATDLYALADSPLGTINAVKGMWRMQRGSGSGGGTHDYAWRVVAKNSSAPFPGITTAFLLHEEIWEFPPEGGGDWTAAKVDGLELGARHNGTQGQDTDLSFTTAMVDYDPSGPSGGTLNCVPVVFAWYDSSWQYRKRIIIDHDKVYGDLTDFPVLVSLSDSDLALGARADGFDIFFTDDDGMTKLAHQIESYDGAGNLVAWVEIPTLLSGVDRGIYMYYGNPSSADQQDVVNTWAADYQAVWHLSESSGAGAYLLNSAQNDHHGTPFNTFFNSAGKFAGARRFADTGSHEITLANASLLFGGWNQFTLDFWIYPDYVSDAAFQAAGEDMFMDGLGPVRLGRVRRGGFEPAGEGSLQIDVQFAGFGTTFNIVPVNRQQWNHIVWTYHGTDYSVFANGVEISRDPIGNDALIANPSFFMGSMTNVLNGSLDEVRISNGGKSSAWIQTEYQNLSAPASFYGVCPEHDFSTTEVELLSFTATAGDGEALVEWQTASELRNLGFHLYRSLSADGPYERVTASPIPGLGSSPEGARYAYRDQGRVNDVTLFYQLEDIEVSGRTELHGPVSATPRAGAILVNERSPVSITIGTPESNRFRIERRGDGLILELITEGFYLLPQEDGRVRIEVPGLDALAESSGWVIPAKRASVEAVAGRKVAFGPARAYDVVVFDGLRLEETGASELVGSPDGLARLGRRPRGAHPLSDSLFPAEAARLLGVGFQGDVKRADVELAPLRWNPGEDALVLTRRLVVPLSFREPDPDESAPGPGRGGRRYRARASHESRSVAVRLVTKSRGLHGVGYEDLFGPGRRGARSRDLAASALRLSRLGITVPFHVEPDGERFGPGSTLFFVSEGPQANPYGQEAVYELEVGPEGKRMPVRDATPEGSRIGVYLERLEREENRLYQAGLVGAADRWLWDVLFAPVTKSHPFTVSRLAPSSSGGHLEVRLQGTSDLPESPDHHVRVSVNGRLVGERSWNGKASERIDVELPEGVLHEGENVLEVENVGDTGAGYSMVMLDAFTLTYQRWAVPQEGALEGIFPAAGTAEVELADGAFVMAGSGVDVEWLRVAEPAADGVLRFRVEEGQSYLLISPSAVKRPLVVKASPSVWKRKRTGADYVAIGPRAFLNEAGPLFELRREQGVRVLEVPLEEIFAEFGFGEPRPEAIRDFLSFAYHVYGAPTPRYVLLLGDATYDFKDVLGTGVANVVPPFLVRTSYLWTASDAAFGSVNDDDLLPDVAMGRLPAATVEELRVMVEKILAYEGGKGSVAAPIVLVTDDSDGAGSFDSDAAELMRTVLASESVERIALGELGVPTTRERIRDAFDRGSSVVSYLGHGGIHVWASENLLDLDGVSELAPQPRHPLVLTVNCLNGYFHFPYFDSLSERLLKVEGKGAVAALSTSGLSLSRPAHLYHRAVLQQILKTTHLRLGDALLAAQREYLDAGGLPELLSIYHLLGDPALVVKRD